MALKPCKECGREISTEAKTCPNCGKLAPTGTPTSPAALGCFFLIILAVIGVITSSGTSGGSSSIAPLTGPVAASNQAAVAAPSLPGSQWHYSHDEDEMSGAVSHIASVASVNQVEFDFPYQGPQRGRLFVRRHPRHGADIIVQIERGQLLCTSYDGCSVLVRFDDGKPSSFSANPPADNSTESIFIQNYERFVAGMLKARRVRISPRVYQEGSVVFEFDVSGFDQAKFRGR